jgi:hypothetical protein
MGRNGSSRRMPRRRNPSLRPRRHHPRPRPRTTRNSPPTRRHRDNRRNPRRRLPRHRNSPDAVGASSIILNSPRVFSVISSGANFCSIQAVSASSIIRNSSRVSCVILSGGNFCTIPAQSNFYVIPAESNCCVIPTGVCGAEGPRIPPARTGTSFTEERLRVRFCFCSLCHSRAKRRIPNPSLSLTGRGRHAFHAAGEGPNSKLRSGSSAYLEATDFAASASAATVGSSR